LKIHHGAKPKVETATGTIHAQKVLLAGNAYLGRTEPRLQGKVVAAGSYIIAPEPLSTDLCTELLPTELACVDMRSALDYFRLSPDGRMLWGGNVAISLNRIPQFGRIEGNTYYVQGYSGHGLAPTHIAGKVRADIVAGDSEQFDIFARVHHWRLPGGKWFGNPVLAAGMLYFRLKELL